jgi:HAE1 family hydrophobic/amphiphilic exporter-1
MLISDIYIKRPVLTIVLALLIIVFGVLSFSKLNVRMLPDIEQGVITVQASYPGSSGSFMEKNVVKILEQNLSTVKNIDTITSSSTRGSANIVIILALGANVNEALDDIRSKVSLASKLLPKDMTLPLVSKFDANSQPSMWLVVSSEKYDNKQLITFLEDNVTSKIERINNVGSASIYGASDYIVKIEPNPEKLFFYKLSPLEIEKAVRTQNADYPVGIIKTQSRDFVMELKGSMKSVEAFNNILISTSVGNIKLSEIANVSFVPKDKQTIMRYNGKDSIAIGITKKPQANLVNMSDDVRKALVDIGNSFKGQVDIKIAFDNAIFVNDAINSVYRTIFEASILVILVILLFLGSYRSTFIPALAIPISLVGVFTFMSLLGFSINLFTLLAMVFSIGLVVDDAIVVLENIFRYIEEGETPINASIKGLKEVGVAVVIMTLTLFSVFIPVGFIDGFIGKLFIEFAWTLALCVLISGFVSITLTPMLCAYLINPKKNAKESRLKIFNKFDALFNYSLNKYGLALNWVLLNRLKFAFISIIAIVIMFFSLSKTYKEFLPIEDQGYLQLFALGQDGTNLDYNLKALKEAEEILSKNKNVEGYLTILGFGSSNKGFGFIPLMPLSKRPTQSVVNKQLNTELSLIPGMNLFSFEPSLVGQGGGSGDGSKDLQLVLTSSNLEYDALNKISNEIMDQIRKNPLFANISKDLSLVIPSININVDKNIAYQYGVPLDVIGATSQYLLSGMNIGYYKEGNNNYDVVIQFSNNNLDNINDLNKIYFKSNNGQMINLMNIATIENQITAKSYNHYELMKSVEIDAKIIDKTKINQVVLFIKDLMSKYVGSDLSYKFIGMIDQMNKSQSQIIQTFAMALIFIYLLLSAQFESFRDSALIMVAVPFSISGGALALWLSGTSLNIYSNIGLITLIGLITKNSIMLIEFANQLKEKSQASSKSAMLDSARLRFRPIMMTSVATIVGSIPMIFSTGSGSAAKQSIGIVISGGMAFGTLFTIFVIPLLYIMIHKEK